MSPPWIAVAGETRGIDEPAAGVKGGAASPVSGVAGESAACKLVSRPVRQRALPPTPIEDRPDVPPPLLPGIGRRPVCRAVRLASPWRRGPRAASGDEETTDRLD